MDILRVTSCQALNVDTHELWPLLVRRYFGRWQPIRLRLEVPLLNHASTDTSLLHLQTSSLILCPLDVIPVLLRLLHELLIRLILVIRKRQKRIEKRNFFIVLAPALCGFLSHLVLFFKFSYDVARVFVEYQIVLWIPRVEITTALLKHPHDLIVNHLCWSFLWGTPE